MSRDDALNPAHYVQHVQEALDLAHDLVKLIGQQSTRNGYLDINDPVFSETLADLKAKHRLINEGDKRVRQQPE